MRALTVGIDLGTTATKVVVYDVGAAAVVADVAASSGLISDHPGWSEADSDVWWANICRLVPEALHAAGAVAGELLAVATTGMIPAVVLVDAVGAVLRRPILQNDARAADDIATMADELAGTDLLERTGSALSQQSVGPTWSWLQRREPEVADSARWLVGAAEWAAMRLGAAAHLERNWSIESGLFTLDGDLLDVVLDAAGMGSSLLPATVRAGTVTGRVCAAAAAATGLPQHLPIVAGGADHVLSALAAGLAEPGTALIKLGGAGDILVVSERRVVDARLYLDAHPQPGRWMPNGCMATSGSLVRWVQHLAGDLDLRDLDAQAAALAPGTVLCLPYFLGEKTPFHDPELRGAFLGLTLADGPAQLHRAALEGVAFGFRHHLDVLAELGLTADRVLVTNGGSSSALWKQIVADVCGVALHPVVGHAGAALGAAIAAAVGVGAADWGDAGRAVTLAEPVVADAARRASYDEAYALWGAAARVLTPISHGLARRAAP